MLFNSWQFLIFFPIVTAAYFLTPHRFRWLILLIASCVFYMAFIPAYILILFTTIVIDYFAGRLIERSEGKRRKAFLSASLIANIGILSLFKYFNFFNANVASIAHLLDWNYSVKALSIVLPIGLSFHTFQAMAYTIEVYRGKQKAEKHFGIYALYVMFYPQLVAGPIERPQNLIHQFYEKHDFDYQRVTDGLKRMAWGLFKKVVVADRLAMFVDPIYGNPTHYHGLPLIFATVLFAFQIYADFSGYSDIALGAASVMGFKLMENFNSPYSSKSISEFWARWHISLSSWIRDYLFLPLSLRKSKIQICFVVLFVFFLVGLWHGAAWTFVLWGLIHGVYLAGSMMTRNLRESVIALTGLSRLPKLLSALQTATTFCLVSFTYIFFRANSVSDAFYIAGHLFSGLKSSLDVRFLSGQNAAFFSFNHWQLYLMVTIAGIAAIELVQLRQRRSSVRQTLQLKAPWIRWAAYYGLALWILAFGNFNASQFIYFQF